MPSTSRPSPCSGCGRRDASNRRTRVSSSASRKTQPRLDAEAPPPRRSAAWRSPKNSPPRTSATAAIRRFPESASVSKSALPARPCRASSTMRGSSDGGMLSTTNQPRSSSALAAVLRPAPDIPVTYQHLRLVHRASARPGELPGGEGEGPLVEDTGSLCRTTRRQPGLVADDLAGRGVHPLSGRLPRRGSRRSSRPVSARCRPPAAASRRQPP